VPIYQYSCTKGAHEFEGYAALTTSPNPPCLECGEETEKVWKLGTGHHGSMIYPYVTYHINGKRIEIQNSRHLSQIEKRYNVRLRDDKSYADEAPVSGKGVAPSKEAVERGRQMMRDIMASVPRERR
jgi:hypothetical protein